MEAKRGIDISTLSLEEIKEGVGGYSTSPQTIPDSDLREFMLKVNGYFEENPKEFYSVGEVTKAVRRELGYDKIPSHLIGKLEEYGITHFFVDPDEAHIGRKGQQIEIEALLAFVHTWKELDKPKVLTEETKDETINRLGRYYASVPLSVSKSKRIPAYLRKKSVRALYSEENDFEEEERGENIKTFSNDDIKNAKSVDIDSINGIIERIDDHIESIRGSGVDSIASIMSWGKLEVSPLTAEIATFIALVAEKKEESRQRNTPLDKRPLENKTFNKEFEGLSYKSLRKYFEICKKELEANRGRAPEEYLNLAVLYKVTRNMLEEE